MKNTALNLQDLFLNNARKERIPELLSKVNLNKRSFTKLCWLYIEELIFISSFHILWKLYLQLINWAKDH